ncbi:putative metallo-beta-lactamase domain protein [Aspergillus lucknowensis]|uniref:Beta-lactamase-like protein n=1 Tax=Aspergillus lucknowensis TaxID=176173 RepID=A0ABR4LE80_9EURO
MTDLLDLIICSTCGTQFSAPSNPLSCKICDDPRQYVPPTGQSWTTLRTLRASQNPTYSNIFTPDPIHGDALISIHTEPRHAIGQRAYLCRTKVGSSSRSGRAFNVLWDCITYIDDDTIQRIQDLGGIDAIVISHPHYYSTHLLWAEIFDCPVYLSAEDEEWIVRRGERQVFFKEGELCFAESGTRRSEVRREGKDGDAELVVIKTGGHFPGSTVLWWKSLRTLLIADTIAVVPSGRYWVDRPRGTASFTFMWSYPNMIPLSADDVHGIWQAIKHTDFEITRGAFIGMDTDTDSKKRLLESAKIFVRAMGYLDHAIHREECL